MSTSDYPSVAVLVVDDEIDALDGTRYTLQGTVTKNIITIQDSRDVMSSLAKHPVGVVLLDLSMPHVSGEVLLPQIRRAYPNIPIIIVTGSNEVPTAVRCMQAGAFDYITKPVDDTVLTASVQRALTLFGVQQEYASFRQRVFSNQVENTGAFSDIVTKNASMRSLFQYVETIARSSRAVMVTGETGTGKELIARALHALSERSGRFVAINVAGLDDTVFSDTLFGHEKGAFTGASSRREGMLRTAHNGTLLLDEIGDLSANNQVKLLRLLQEGEYLPLGSDIAQISTARIVVSTHWDLMTMQKAGTFRSDLFYRLQSHHVHVPPLRERLDDLPLLVDHFLERAALTLEKKKPMVPYDVLALLMTYPFPGNIRELEAKIYDAVSRCTSDTLSPELFDLGDSPEQDVAPLSFPEDMNPLSLFAKLPTLKEIQRLLIKEAMTRSEGNQTRASRLLGITQPGLSRALKRDKEKGYK